MCVLEELFFMLGDPKMGKMALDNFIEILSTVFESSGSARKGQDRRLPVQRVALLAGLQDSALACQPLFRSRQGLGLE